MYPTMETYATPCDDFPECVDGEDEKMCNNDTKLNIVLILSVIFIALLYLFLKLWRLACKNHGKDENKKKHHLDSKTKKILRKFSKSPDSVKVIEKLNVNFYFIISTESDDKIKSLSKDFYSRLENIYDHKRAEIFSFLHKNMDPLIMKNIINSQFPGVAERFITIIKEKLVIFDEKIFFAKRLLQDY